MYSEKVMDHFQNPRNVGEIPDADGIGKVGNPTCGDLMYIYIKVEGGILKDVKFKTFGCGAAIATSSMLTELVRGKPVDARSDLFSLGCVLYECVSGDKPFRASTAIATLMRIMNDEPTALDCERLGLHPDIEQVAHNADVKQPFEPIGDLFQLLFFVTCAKDQGPG